MVQASAGGLGMGPLGLRGHCCVVELFSAGLVPLWGSVALTVRKGGGLARLSGCSGSALPGGAGVFGPARRKDFPGEGRGRDFV